jgi:predicted cupin superfamily sugar epimerase
VRAFEPTPSEPLTADPQTLGMRPHPEGGWFRETWRHGHTVDTDRGSRPLATAIVFLLLPGEQSTWHRVASAELWLWQGGGPVQLQLGGDGPYPAGDERVELGCGGQFLVPAHHWQRANPAGERATVVGCIVSPGFDFDDFELADSPS